MKRILTIGVILLFIGSISSSTGFNVSEQANTAISNGKTLYVGGSGPGNYTKIQDAIDNASDGDTVFVYNDSSPYYEYPIIINKSINLIGEDRESTIIYGTENEWEIYIIIVEHDYVNISSFSINNASEGSAITLWYADYVRISNCIIDVNGYGNGTWIPSPNNYTIIENCTYMNAGIGIYHYYGYNNKYTDNVIVKNSWYGILLRNSLSSGKNFIMRNNICNNGLGLFLGVKSNYIYHNNFIDNTRQAWDNKNNTWDKGYSSGGNYWSDYTGNDSDGDGIGDTPYPIPGGDNEDRYPLMEPWGGNFNPIAKFTWKPSLPDPKEIIRFNASKSIDYDGNIILYEWDWDNDGEFDENHTNYTAAHSWSDYGYYPVTLRITDNDNLTDVITKTVRVGNLPPYEPSNPQPPDGATYVSSGGISWTGGDPDPDDSVTYDVYIGKSSPPPLVVVNLPITVYDLGVIDFNTTYYWQIVTWDNHNASTRGPIWSFTTRGNNPPNAPIIEGPILVRPGTYNYTFYSTDPEIDEVFYWINKSDGDVEWIGPFESGKKITIPITWYKKGTYTIKVKAKDIFGNESGWGILKVTVPKNRNMWFKGWFDRFPLLNYLLMQFMERWNK